MKREILLAFFVLIYSFCFSQQSQLYYELSLDVGFSPSGGINIVSESNCHSFDRDYQDNDVIIFENSICNITTPLTISTQIERYNSIGAEDFSSIQINIGESIITNLEANDGGAIHKLKATYTLLELISITQPIETECQKIQINATEDHPDDAYNWKFRGTNKNTGLDSWEDIPIQQNQESIELTLNDLYGSNSDLYIDNPVEFKVYNKYGDYYSDIRLHTFTDCSPQLTTNPPQAVQMTCSDSDDGGFIARFDRELDASRNERMLLYVEKFDTNTSAFDYLDMGIPILSNTNINNATNNTYTSPRNLPSGRYHLRWISKYDPSNGEIERANSAEQSAEFVIDPVAPITFSNDTPIDVSCYGGNDGSVTITNVQNGSGTYEYSNDDGVTWQSSPTFTGLVGNNYTLRVRDSNGCVAPTTIPINISTPSIEFTYDFDTIVQINENGADNGSITLDISGGEPNFTYNWTLNGVAYQTTTTPTIANLASGTYGVTVTDSKGCTATAFNPSITTVTITEPPPLTVQFTVPTPINCFGGIASINAQASGGNGAPYTYTWGNGTTGTQLPNVNAGTYTIVVADKDGKTINTSYTLEQPDELTVSPSQTNVSCFNGNDGSLNLAIAGGTGAYTIEWADGTTITTANRTNLTFGDYFYTIVDAQGCSVTGSVSITQPLALSIAIDSFTDPTTVGGNDGGINVSITGGTTSYTYSWTNQSGTVIATTEDINGLVDGNYTLLVTDANDCTATITQRITEPQPLSVTITESVAISCIGSSDGQLTAEPFGGDGNYTVEWFIDNSGTFDALGSTDLILSNLSTGTYRVVATDGLNDTAQFDFTLNDPSPIQVSEILKNITCYGGSDGAIDIDVTGGAGNYTFSWTDSSGTIIATSEDITGLSAGTYTLSVTDQNLCNTNFSFELIAPQDQLAILLDNITDPNAAGANNASIDVTIVGGTAPYSYEWTDTSGTIIATSEDISGIGEGVYTLTVRDNLASTTTDNSGCIVSEDFAILAPDAIAITFTETQSIACFDDDNGVLTANVTGGVVANGSNYTYQWFVDDNGIFIDINQNTSVATNLSAGLYRLTVTDDNGIEQSANYTLNQPNELQLSLTVTSIVTCQSGNDGAINSTVSGGIEPYTYAWSNGETTANISQLPVGNYTLVVTDANDCTTEQTIEVIQPDGMTIVPTVTPPLCNGSSDGSITLNVSGGNPNYTYLWNTGATAAAINNLPAGQYNVTITDSKGCIALQEFTLENPEPLTLDLDGDRVLCAGQTHDIDATIKDAGATYQWTSDNGFTSNNSSVSLTDVGTYTLTITNSNGCVATDTFALDFTNEEISADFLVATNVFVDETIVVVDVSNPVPDTVTWEFSEGTVISQNNDYAEVKFEKEGTYYVTMTTTKGSCYETLTKEINVLPKQGQNSQNNQKTAFIKEFNVYPNPSNGIFKTKVELKEVAPIKVKVVNLLANTVSNYKIAQNSNEYIVDYNLNAASGTYILILETPKGNASKKIVVK